MFKAIISVPLVTLSNSQCIKKQHFSLLGISHLYNKLCDVVVKSKVKRLFSSPFILLVSANSQYEALFISLRPHVYFSPVSQSTTGSIESQFGFFRLDVFYFYFIAPKLRVFIHLKALWFLSILQHPQEETTVSVNNMSLYTLIQPVFVLRR